jgi:hypothetical protein
MVNLIDSGVGALKSSGSRIQSGLHNASVQSALFGAITFLIVAHPATFKFVDSVLKIKDKNLLLLVHSLVFAVIMYFGTRLIFKPALDMILREGMGPRLGEAQWNPFASRLNILAETHKIGVVDGPNKKISDEEFDKMREMSQQFRLETDELAKERLRRGPSGDEEYRKQVLQKYRDLRYNVKNELNIVLGESEPGAINSLPDTILDRVRNRE